MEKVLNYSRSIVAQETGYWCGPATLQNILNNRGVNVSESTLASAMGTTVNGTNHIGLLTTQLNNRTGGKYVTVQMPNDPPTAAQANALWSNIVGSINAGYGVAVNIVAPPSNYPRAVAPSTISPAYSGGTVYHYIAVMGYSDVGQRKYWVADSGFSPYGYWISHNQLASLIPPKGYSYSTLGVSAPPAPARTGMDAATLRKAMQETYVSDAVLAHYLPYFVEAMRAANINTVRRAAAWCAQIGHESSGLRYMEEIASGAAYEGRTDLGNTQPGDGVRFKGRGPIQLTGRHNYTRFSQWCKDKGYTSDANYLVNNPAKVAEPKWGFLAASWYWTVARTTINQAADAGNFTEVTRLINGGQNGAADRVARYNRCLALGSALLPGDSFPSSAADIANLAQLGPS